MITIGLVGAGQHAMWAVIPALAKTQHCRLVAACDLREEQLSKIQDPSVKRFTSFSAMLDSCAFDCLYVATLEDTHRDIVLQGFAAGRHVMCEKPLGMNAAECGDMVAAARRADRKLAVGFEKRYHPDSMKAREVIASGRLGQVQAVHFQEMWDAHKTFGNLAARRAAHVDRSGCLDCGIHCLDLVRYLTGGGAWQNLAARGRWFNETERLQPVHVSLIGDLDTGILATLNASYAYTANIQPHLRSFGLTVVGDRGAINWASDGEQEIAFTIVDEKGIERLAFPSTGHASAIQTMMDDFARVLAGKAGWPAELATGEDGLAAQQAVDEALRQCHDLRPGVRK
jgi:predicted dehydrogenase